jgi:hypothetical protein
MCTTERKKLGGGWGIHGFEQTEESPFVFEDDLPELEDRDMYSEVVFREQMVPFVVNVALSLRRKKNIH